MNTENMSASLDSAFDNAETVIEEPSATDEVIEVVEDVTPEVAPEPVEEYTPLDAPEFFSKDNKSMFAKMQENEDSRGYAKAWHEQHTTDQEFINSKLAESSNYKRDLDAYNQAFEPLHGVWASKGMNPQMGAAQLAHLGNMITNDPEQLMKEIAQKNNIDLNKMVEDQPYVDPQVAQLQQQVQEMQMQSQQQYQYQQNQQQLQTNETVQNQITEFQSATDENGNSKYPHFAKLRDQMGEIMMSQYNDITEMLPAYERAAQYNPEIQAEIQAQAKKIEAESKNVQAIKATTASSKTTSNNQDAPVKTIGWEEQMEIDLRAAEAS